MIYINFLKAVRDYRGFRFNQNPKFKERYWLKDQNGHMLAVIPECTLIQDIVDARTALITTNQELKNLASISAHGLKKLLRMVSQFLTKLNQRNQDLFDEKPKKIFSSYWTAQKE